MAPDPAPLSVAFGGRTLKISSLDKVLYPATGTTKGEVLDYYVSVAPAILPQLRDRAVTRVRFPHGVAAGGFFEKNAPAGTPKWIERVPLPADGVAGSDSTTIRWPLLGEIAALVWAVNLGSLELHTPQWRIGHGCPREPAFPDRLVIDLDPGPGTGLAECSVVALRIRDRLRAIGIEPRPVTSGSKGLHVYAAVPDGFDAHATSAITRDLAKAVAAELPELVVWQMAKDKRIGRVFVDWSQNSSAKTTVTPYSLRGQAHPQVAAPRTWEEIEKAVTGAPLGQLGPTEVLARLAADGDLMA